MMEKTLQPSKITILNVNDNDASRYAIGRVLRRAEFVVVEAATGAEALRLAREHPDLIVLDIQLPDITGFEVCQRLKADPATSPIPILYLSAIHRDDQSKVEGLDRGADGYLTAPVEPSVLVSTVRALLRVRQAEANARTVARQWQTTFDAIGDAVSLIDLEGRILRCNEAMVRLVQQPHDKIVGTVCWELVHSTSESIQEYSLVRMRETKCRETMLLPLGDQWFDVTVDPLLDGEGTLIGAVHIMTDITKRKQAEEELIRHRDHLEELVAERTVELRVANTELARAARLKDEFLAAMSHELRTPLNAILGLSEALQDQVYGSLNEKQLKSLGTIEESGSRLLALINNILDMAKIGAGQLELQITPVYVEQVCEASLEAVKQAARKKRLRVASTYDGAVTTVHADGRRLKQILVNMLSNAVKFTPEGGAIGLEVEGDIEGEAVHFAVWDTGIGISQEDMERLFGGPGNGPQLFVQLDGSLARRYEGTGLGLALVRHLAEMHGGGVTVESEVGRGSRFTVSLPCRVRPKRS